MTEGTTACTGNAPNEVLDTTTWQFMENEAKLMLETDVFTIEQLDGNTMILSITESGGGISYTTKITMSH